MALSRNAHHFYIGNTDLTQCLHHRERSGPVDPSQIQSKWSEFVRDNKHDGN